jgi:regulator of cell morphogenesis and NO signaling
MIDVAPTTTVSEIVTADPRAAAVFEQFGIDFCCGGRRTFDEACRAAAVDPGAVVSALDVLPSAADREGDAAHWPLPRLIDYIVSTHHAYVRTSMPAIARYLAKLNEAHGARHPELARVGAYFDQVRIDLEQHMMKEERVLFPYVRDLAERPELAGRMPSPFGTIENPIRMMEREHQEAAEAMRTIRELTRGYVAPEDGCATYGACLAELQRFERDLHRHVHLENNVLFPAAVRIEQLHGAGE